MKAILKFLGYLKHNVKLYLGIGAGIVLVTAVVVLVNHLNSKREEKARTELYELSKKIELLDDTQTDVAIKLIEEELPRLGITKAGFEARYILAEIYYSGGDWPNAISNYDFVARKAKGLFRELSLLGAAYARENSGDIQSALKAFQKIKNEGGAIYKPVAMLGVGRCYKKLGLDEMAMAEYESVILSYPETDYARMASVAKNRR